LTAVTVSLLQNRLIAGRTPFGWRWKRLANHLRSVLILQLSPKWFVIPMLRCMNDISYTVGTTPRKIFFSEWPVLVEINFQSFNGLFLL
jgi:hypothetical protein